MKAYVNIRAELGGLVVAVLDEARYGPDSREQSLVDHPFDETCP